MSKKANVRSEKDLARGWRVYKLAQKIVECIREKDAKCVRGVWVGRREKDALTIFSAIGKSTKSGHPSFVAARIDYKGTTVLDTIYNESRHDVLTFAPGAWERRLRSLQRKEARNV